MSSLRALQRFARPPSAQGPGAHANERCELCHAAVGPGHSHLVDLDRRQLACACRPCALLFMTPGAARGRYRTVPDRVLSDPSARLEDAEWAGLEVPVRLAFFFRNARADRWVAFYPSPAGATECELPLEAWSELVRRNRLIAAAEPDVEAVIAWGGRRDGPFELFLVPITAPYELVARVRKNWRGFDGGDDVRREIESFFAELRQRSEPLPSTAAGGES